MPEGFYEDLFLCHECWFSDEIKLWRDNKEKSDPQFRRYMELLTAGFKVNCPDCGKETNRNPKFIGHLPSWEICCTKCSEIDYEKVSPYEYDLTQWHEMYGRLIRGALDIEVEWGKILKLNEQSKIPTHNCRCGGKFSLLAKPRCSNCNSVVSNTIFHVCNEYYA
jgi:endogenous inhibitor of DNA gyrase (YacG/DUF329 family)